MRKKTFEKESDNPEIEDAEVEDKKVISDFENEGGFVSPQSAKGGPPREDWSPASEGDPALPNEKK